MDNQRSPDEMAFVEDFGVFFEHSGFSRMAGRIVGWLLIADPPYQSTDELAKTLMASKGSISTMTRLLIQLSLVERVSLPGIRHSYFRIKPGASRNWIERHLDGIVKFRQFADRGLALTKGKSSLARQASEEMRNTFFFYEQELPVLLKRWEEEYLGNIHARI